MTVTYRKPSGTQVGKLFNVLLEKLFVLLSFIQENQSLLFAVSDFVVAYVQQFVQIDPGSFGILENVFIFEIRGHEMLKVMMI